MEKVGTRGGKGEGEGEGEGLVSRCIHTMSMRDKKRGSEAKVKPPSVEEKESAGR